MKTKEQIRVEEEIGDVFKTSEFTELVNAGAFISYDGFGYFHDGEENKTKIEVFSDTGVYRYDLALSEKYPYVVWFNK